jgi:N-acetylglutamate synthase-like GNAT family acetyltransferase
MTRIRAARSYDVPAIATLCGELGYPASRPEISRRLAELEAAPAHGVWVAEDVEGRVVGWLHAARCLHLADDDDVEVLGLVVAEAARGSAVGLELLRVAEDWAAQAGVARVRVRSRIERERAHNFYAREGYSRVKVQLVLDKRVG